MIFKGEIVLLVYGCGANADTQVKYCAPDFANEAKRRGQRTEVQWPASPWGGLLIDRGATQCQVSLLVVYHCIGVTKGKGAIVGAR